VSDAINANMALENLKAPPAQWKACLAPTYSFQAQFTALSSSRGPKELVMTYNGPLKSHYLAIYLFI